MVDLDFHTVLGCLQANISTKTVLNYDELAIKLRSNDIVYERSLYQAIVLLQSHTGIINIIENVIIVKLAYLIIS
ncbi:MAG: hypothetical protein AAFQ91_28775 [Cyanobacteria bacterium J06621_15]